MLRTSIAAVVAAALAAPSASAAAPDRHRPGPFEPFVDPPGVACPAAIAPSGILWEDAGGPSSMMFFENGRFLLTGRHPDRVTDVASGEALLLDLQGSASAVPRPDGGTEWRLSGSSAFTFFPGDVGPGDQGTGRIFVFTGTVRLVTDADGVVTQFSSSGRRRDVCAELA